MGSWIVYCGSEAPLEVPASDDGTVETPPPKVDVSIKEIEDISFGGKVRKTARVVIEVDRPPEALMKQVADAVWEQEGIGTDEFVVWLYQPSMDVNGAAYATAHYSRGDLDSFSVNDIAAIDLDGPNCLEFNQYRAEDYKYDWFDRNGRRIGESTGGLLEKIVWRNPVDGRLVAFDPEEGEPFADQSAAIGHYFTAPDCDESGEKYTDYFYQGELVWPESLDDPLCIQHPFLVGTEMFYGFMKTGEVKFHYRSSRVPISVNPEKKCDNFRTEPNVNVIQGHLVEAEIELPPGPYSRKPK
jgi:hypothetical protein